MCMGAPMIKVEGISKKYPLNAASRAVMQNGPAQVSSSGKIQAERISRDGMLMALSDVSFEVSAGETLGVIGRNGAGKSTLFKLITRITQPSAGKIYLNGRVASMIEVGTGFHRDLTGRENIYINGAILGMGRREIDRKLDEIIAFSECSQFIDMPVKYYSSGMYMKLAFSVAAHLDAEIILMDEVFAVGDILFRNKCIKKMREISASGRTILSASHSLNLIRSICSRCIVLDQGKLVYDGDVETAIGRYLFDNSLPPVFGTYMEPQRDLAQLTRPYATHQMARMEYIALDGSNMFSMGGMLRFRLRWKAEKRFEHLSLRAGIWSESNGAAAISFADIPSSLLGEGEHEACFCVDTSCLLPGHYGLELVLSEDDPAWKQDVLRDVLGFEILKPNDSLRYRTHNRDWGYIELPMTSERV